MDRRQFLALAGSAAGIGGTGAALSGASASDGFEEPSVADAAGATDDPSPATTVPAAELEVYSRASGTIETRLQLQRYDDLRTVYDRTRALDYGERVFLSGRLDSGTDYLFDLSVDDVLLIERPVYAGERVVLEISGPKPYTVTVVEHTDV
ncbi:hypothetical protein [Haloarchaeobius sp. HRN-SO-5]|uniref:hypothetical protein n=1 Tax=Haloarchaeobius sp. HRN-SO-5 TaxID=3446118 RepID=UPI003EBDC09D